MAHAPNSAALCDEYEDCRCDLWSADARVPPSRWAVAPARCSASSAASTTAAASAATAAYLVDQHLDQVVAAGNRDGQWVRVLPDISTTWDDAEAELVLYKADPQQPGRVLVTETAMDDEGDWSHRTAGALRPVP